MDTLSSMHGELLRLDAIKPGVDRYSEPLITVPGVPSEEQPSFGEFRKELDMFLKCMCRDCIGVFLSLVNDEFKNDDFLFPIDISL